MRDWQRTARQRRQPTRPPPVRPWLPLALLALLSATFVWYEQSSGVPAASVGATFSCTVASVTDGDTFRCSDGTRVRLSAIAARERDGTCRPGHPCPAASAASATEALERLALGRTISCEADGESYGRITAWCSDAAGTQLNCAMVSGGYAERWAKHDPYGRLCAER